MADILDNILELRKKSLKAAKEQISLQDLEKQAASMTGRSFLADVTKNGQICVIAEMKRQSPSAGVIRETYDVAGIAAAYERGGASALSVLTESDFFGGNISDIRKAREASRLPILRKDFIFDPYQVVEAKAFGADAVLLIADMLSPDQMKELVWCARHFMIEPLVEVFTDARLPLALNSEAKLIGINTRNLRTLQMNPDNILTLSRMIPRDRFVVAESGIKTPEDIERIKALRVSSVLVGESLMKQEDLESAVRTLAEAGKKEV